jgi:hypothetical protein
MEPANDSQILVIYVSMLHLLTFNEVAADHDAPGNVDKNRGAEKVKMAISFANWK